MRLGTAVSDWSWAKPSLLYTCQKSAKAKFDLHASADANQVTGTVICKSCDAIFVWLQPRVYGKVDRCGNSQFLPYLHSTTTPSLQLQRSAGFEV